MTTLDHLDVGPTDAERGAEAGRPPLLFLHGLGGNATSWQPQLEAFSATRRCIAWTMPGYGRSTPLGTDPPTIAALATAAVTLLDQLAVESVVVIGHSLGGFVAQELALAHRRRVDRLVLVGTSASFGKPGSTFNDEFLAARLEPLDAGRTPADLAATVVDGLVGPDASTAVRAEARASMSAISTEGYRAALEALVGHDAVDRLPTLTVPTLGIAGELDRTAPVRSMQRLVQLIPSARLHVLAGCGHLINNEVPQEFNRVLADYLG